MGNRPVFPPFPCSYEVPNSAVPGVSGPVYRHPDHVEQLLSHFEGEDGIVTSFDVFRDAAERYPDRPCHGTRPLLDDGGVGPFEWQTYKDVYNRIVNFGRGIEELNLLSDDGSMRLIGLYMKNRSEWVIAEQGAFTRRATTVPLYDTLGEDAVEYVINQTLLKTVICSSEEIPKLLACKPCCPSLKCIVCLNTTESIQASCEAANLELIDFHQVEVCGSVVTYEPLSGQSLDIGTFCYTSGTTGVPKGALLSQGGMLANIAGLTEFVTTKSPLIDFGSTTETYLSYLPLAHVMERLIQAMMYHFGAAIGFSQGDPRKIMDDVRALRPTLFVGVPRILNRIYDGVVADVRKVGGAKQAICERALKEKKEGLSRGFIKHPIWDSVVFNGIKAKLGLDRVRLVASGSAPLASYVLLFLRALLGCPVVEGYGQTEATCAVSYGHMHDFTVGHVGLPVGCLEIKLVDVPEMGYRSTDTEHGGDAGGESMECKGRGEICYRGPCTFKGYYKMPDKTEDTIDTDGWVHSGDIGIWLKDGQLKIIDRKKSIFKLSQGEYIAPDKVENTVVESPLVAQAFVYGNSFQSRLVAIIVPDLEYLLEHFPSITTGIKSSEELCSDEGVRRLVMRSINDVSNEGNKLRGFEKVKAIHLTPAPFTIDNGLLTPSFKLKREVALQTYRQEINALYEEIGDKVSNGSLIRQ
ncbi:hypothetical protein FOL47_010106 [Perkinsus chesapeaki]|uniref:AMP-dependent synthetase/ligase domain-containing protein n=1 Tax=Perkinsus chesapeaki TaxID=330153 RepID=A0A7J6L3W2_PERCH|nr:hypothetical protein FOL47_010106 [Perkinsus chesapeaki]